METTVKQEDHSVFLKTEETEDDQELLPQYKSNFTETRSVFLETNKLGPGELNISDYPADICVKQEYPVLIKAEELDDEIEAKPEYVNVLMEERNSNVYIKTEEFDIILETNDLDRSGQPLQSSTQNGKEAISEPSSIAIRHTSAPAKPLHKCEICSFETKYKASLATHTLTHKSPSEITLYQCDICTYTTKYKGNFDNHVENHNSPENATYKCEFCPYASNYKRNYGSHMLRHKNFCERALVKTVYKCDICQFETNYKKPFMLHNLTHKNLGDVATYKCTLCSHQTKYKRNLKKHLLLHKDSAEVTMYKCYLCPFEAKYKRYLIRHMQTHKSPSGMTMLLNK